MADIKQELNDSFAKFQKETGMKTSRKDFEELMSLTEYVVSSNFVHQRLGLQLLNLVQDKLNNFLGLLQSYIMPNQGSYLSMTETGFFSDEQKQEVVKMINQIMACLYKTYIAKNSEVSLQAKTIDECTKVIKEIIAKMIPLYETGRDGWSNL